MLVSMVSTQVCGTCSMGSNPVHHPNLGVAQPGSASGLGPEGREFESLHRDQFIFIECAFYGVHLRKTVVEYIYNKEKSSEHNAVKPVNDYKIKTLVGNYRAPSLERPTIIEERQYGNT